MRLGVVIAAWDERETIPALVRRLATTLERLPEVDWAAWFVVAGRDGTRETLEELREREGWPLHVLYEAEPQGLGTAFRRGFAALPEDLDYVVTMDADLNHQPEELPRLLREIGETGVDILVGSRFQPGSEVAGTPLWKRFLSGTMNRVMSVLYGLDVRDKTSGYRIYRGDVLRDLRFRNRQFAFLPEILIVAKRRGARIGEAPIRFVFRSEGTSKMRILPTTLSYLGLLAARFRPAPRSGREGRNVRRSADSPEGRVAGRGSASGATEARPRIE